MPETDLRAAIVSASLRGAGRSSVPSEIRSAAVSSLLRASDELASVLDRESISCLVPLLSSGTVRISFSVSGMARAHADAMSEAMAPQPPHSIATLPSQDASCAARGQELPRSLSVAWDALESKPGEGMLARLTAPMAGDPAAAETLAECFLGDRTADWFGPMSSAGRIRDAVEAACREWFASDLGPMAHARLRSSLLSDADGFVARLRAYLAAARAWLDLRDAAWHAAETVDGHASGYACPYREARRFRAAWRRWERLVGEDADRLFTALMAQETLAGHGGHLYIFGDTQEDASVFLLVSSHEVAIPRQTLTGIDHTLRLRLCHELAHLVWLFRLDGANRSSVASAWASGFSGSPLASVYARTSPEEAFCEHVAARVSMGWGIEYRQHRAEDLGRSDAGPHMAAAVESLAMLGELAARGNPVLEAAAGCFLPATSSQA